MPEAKTLPTKASVTQFLASVPDADRRADSKALLHLLQEVTGLKPVMWGPSMVGFGSYHYKYGSGREGIWPLTGFSPRKNELTIYLTPGCAPYRALLARLGKHRAGVGCLYLKRLADVDQSVLRELVGKAFEDAKAQRG